MIRTHLYHNPRCSKSKKALEIIKSCNINVNVILYLEEKLTADMLNEILELSGLTPRNIIRTNEKEYKDNNLDNNALTQDQILQYILKFPILLQRPIFIFKNKAIIARPPENILKII